MPFFQRINRVLAIQVCRDNILELIDAGCSVRLQGGTYNIGKEVYSAEYGDKLVVNHEDWFVRDVETGKGKNIYKENFGELYTLIKEETNE